jgi:hypothetical protein
MNSAAQIGSTDSRIGARRQNPELFSRPFSPRQKIWKNMFPMQNNVLYSNRALKYDRNHHFASAALNICVKCSAPTSSCCSAGASGSSPPFVRVQEVVLVVLVVLVVFAVIAITAVNIGQRVATQLGHQALHQRVAALAQLADDGFVARRTRRALVVGGTACRRVVKGASARRTNNSAYDGAIRAVWRTAYVAACERKKRKKKAEAKTKAWRHGGSALKDLATGSRGMRSSEHIAHKRHKKKKKKTCSPEAGAHTSGTIAAGCGRQ